MFTRLLIWSVALAAALLGQANLATVTGVVTDVSGAAIPGAGVSIRNIDTNAVRAMETNAEGVYALTNLAPGPHELDVAMAGFRSWAQTGIELQVGQTLRADVRLELGQVNECAPNTSTSATCTFGSQYGFQPFGFGNAGRNYFLRTTDTGTAGGPRVFQAALKFRF